MLVVIKITCAEYLRHRDLIGLPRTHLDLRCIMVGHIHQQEEVTFVRVTGRGVFLTYLYAVDFRILIFLQPLHVIVRKTQVDEFVQFERTGQVGQIGLLVITVIFDEPRCRFSCPD